MAGNKSLGCAHSIGTLANVTAYTAHDSGAVTVTSEAATDLDTTAAQVALLTTKLNSLLTKLRAAGYLD